METAELALWVAFFSLVISGLAFWYAHLQPFSLSISHSTPRLSMYTITPKISGDENGNTWWIPSFDISATFFNNGKKKGDVYDIRIAGSMKNNRSERRLYYYPKWVVDYAKYNECSTERFKWLSNSVIRDWYPARIGSDFELSVHLILEGDRIDSKEEGLLEFEFQVATSEKEGWQTLEKYELHISKDIYESKSTYSPYSPKIEQLRKIA